MNINIKPLATSQVLLKKSYRQPFAPFVRILTGIVLIGLISACADASSSSSPNASAQSTEAILKKHTAFSQRLKKSDCNDKLHIQSINLFLFFDHRKDGARYEKTFSKAQYKNKQSVIHDYLKLQTCLPDIIAVQEVESKRVLKELSQTLSKKSGWNYRYLLQEGHDQQGIDVGFLYRDTVELKGYKLIDKNKSRQSGGFIHDRPPLVADFFWKENQQNLQVVNVHLRSMRGIEESQKGQRIAQKRRAQAKSIAAWVNKYGDNKYTVVLGDFNTPWFDKPLKTEPLDILNKQTSLHLLTQYLPKKEQYSYKYHGKKLLLDHMLISENLVPQLSQFNFVRGFSCTSTSSHCDATQIISDHEPVHLALSQTTRQ